MRAAIPYGRQDISEDDIQAVVNVLRSSHLTQGPVVPAFEQCVADYCAATHAIAVNSATSALHIACLALGVGAGDFVWTSPNTFVASANCARYCGAEVDFVDIDPRTYNMSVDILSHKLALAEQNGTLPKVVIPVHFAGQSCEMRAIKALSERYGFKIIEDAAHAIGGRYLDDPIGCCRYSDITIFSFHPVKIVTAGEGGMAVTHDEVLAKRMRRLRSHGISSDPLDMEPRSTDEIWNYQQIDLGFNYRMTDIHAALGLSQMRRLDQFVTKRHEIAKRYDVLFKDEGITTPWQHPDSYSSYHLYPICLQQDQIELSHQLFYRALVAEKILVNLHYIPVYRQPYYEALGFKAGYCPNAENYFKAAMSIPIYSTLTDVEQNEVVSEIRKVLH